MPRPVRVGSSSYASQQEGRRAAEGWTSTHAGKRGRREGGGMEGGMEGGSLVQCQTCWEDHSTYTCPSIVHVCTYGVMCPRM